MKRIVSVFFVVLMLLIFALLSSFLGLEMEPKAKALRLAENGKCGDDVYWNFEMSTGDLTISGHGPMTDYKTGVLLSSPFYAETTINTVTIEAGVTSIGDLAFIGCSNITSLTIGNSVTSIGNSAFGGCSNLTNVTIPNSVTSIGNSAFGGCSILTSVTIPDSVTSIGNSAFYNCTALENVTIPDRVTSIGNSAFYSCSKLTSVVIGNEVRSIGEKAFYTCCSLTSVTFGNNLISIGDNAFFGCSSLTKVLIPNKVTSIGTEAFIRCSNLTSVKLGDCVKSIGARAFYNCTNLGSFTFGNSVESIGEGAFNNCSLLEDITIPDSVTSIGIWAFNACSSLRSVSVGNGVTSIGSNTFYNCSNLSFLTIGNSVVSIDDSAFSGCESLMSVIIPESVTSIGNHTFEGCKNLTYLKIGNNVTTIGGSAFYFCRALTRVDIPSSVTSIGSEAFGGCSNQLTVHIADLETWCEIDFKDSYANPLAQSGKLFLDNHLITNLIIPDSITRIRNNTFYHCICIKSVSIPTNIEEIGNKAFYRCNNLEEVKYAGTEDQWNQIALDSSNESLINATIHFDSTGQIIETGEIQAVTFDPQSTTGIYQLNGTLDNYVTTVVLNGSDIYVGSVIISGKEYNVKKDIISEEKAKQLKGKNVICNYDKKEEKIIAISKCREFLDLDATDISTINKERSISVKIENEYKWSSGKVRIAGGTIEVIAIPFEILISNSLPSAYYDLTDECKNNSKFDLKISSLQVRGVENCGDVTLYNNSPRTIKLGGFALIRGSIKIPSDFWLGYEDVEKKITAEYGILLNDVKLEWGAFHTVVKNRDPKPQPQSQQEAYNYNKLLADAANKLKSSSVISLTGLADLGFSLGQRQFLEKLVLVELSLFTMPKESLEEYVSNKVMEKIFGAKKLIDVQNGKMTIVVPYQNRTKQLDIVCDIQEYSLTNRTFGNFTALTYHAYDIKNGNREKTAFEDGIAGLAVSVNAKAFAEAATDFALAEIKSATKTVLEGYEEVERIIFGDAALKILKAAGYNSNFDFGWDLYVNECKKLAFECPVDVYVYDEHDNLCGAIVNNAVTLDTSELVDLEVKNDEKIVILWEDGYYVKTLANCEGTLDISVKEMGYINGAIRTLTFESLPLSAGTLYRQSYGTDYYDDQSAYAVEELNGDRIEATSDTLNQQFELTASDHTHTYTAAVTTEPTCSEPGETTYTCTVCGDTYTEPIPATGNHEDSDNDGHCDTCKQQMTGGNHCKYCGKIHDGLFGWLVKFFHSILAIFKR